MNKKPMSWTGVLPAMTTAFNPDLSVDHAFVARHAAWLVDNGCTGLVALGSLGESATLRFSEKVDILRTLVQAVGARVTLVGNPVRPDIRGLHDRPFTAPTVDGPIHVLVTGGSQGARILAETAPRAIAALPEGLRARLKVRQQARAESLEAARQIYLEAGVEAEVAPFFRDMAARLAETHLLIGRAGASTCSELAVAGVPSLLVPLKIATDDHQRFNALSLVEAGGAEMMLEDEVTVDRMAAVLARLLTDPARLAAMSAGARSAALPDATARLADMVETAAG